MASVASGDDNEIYLNVMPLLDIFSLLILFLLMSYSSDPISTTIEKGLILPNSMTTSSLDEVPTVVASKTKIIVNDKVVDKINGDDVSKDQRRQGAIYPLYKELNKLFKANKRFAKLKNPSPITLEMDKSHKFKFFKRIMLSAQQAGFIEFKLMVNKDSN